MHPFSSPPCTLLAHPLTHLPSRLIKYFFFHSKPLKGFVLPEYKIVLPLELLMVAEKQKKVRNTSL